MLKAQVGASADSQSRMFLKPLGRSAALHRQAATYFVVQLIVQLPQQLFTLVKRQIEIRRVARMSPEELQQWREQKIAKLHARAVREADRARDKNLAKQGLTRADYARRRELMVRVARGREMSQNLVDGMDVRGLRDLRALAKH